MSPSRKVSAIQQGDDESFDGVVPIKTVKKSELERPYEIITANVFE